jgi:hypothetical protein
LHDSILLKNPNHQKLAPKKTIETPSGKIKTVYTPFVRKVFGRFLSASLALPKTGGFSAESRFTD